MQIFCAFKYWTKKLLLTWEFSLVLLLLLNSKEAERHAGNCTRLSGLPSGAGKGLSLLQGKMIVMNRKQRACQGGKSVSESMEMALINEWMSVLNQLVENIVTFWDKDKHFNKIQDSCFSRVEPWFSSQAISFLAWLQFFICWLVFSPYLKRNTVIPIYCTWFCIFAGR